MKMFDFGPVFETIKDSSDPEERQLAHDLQYMGDAFDEAMVEFGDTSWHNAGLDLIGETTAPEILEGITRATLVAGPDMGMKLFGRVLTAFFIAGYIAGEGPEHIAKCTCEHKGEEH